MKILRFDSVGGASGDMILGALVGLGADPDFIRSEISKLIPSETFRFNVGSKSSFGASGIHLTVEIEDQDDSHRHVEGEHCHSDDHGCGDDHNHGHDHAHDGCHAHCHGAESAVHGHSHGESNRHSHAVEHVHHHVHGRTYADIREMLEGSSLDARAKEIALAAFAALARAEAEAHHVDVEQVHFHEVGAVDSIVDTVGCALAYVSLGVDGVSLSPLPTGEGTFVCAHGTYPLPAPATSILLREYGLPVSYDVEQCEMLTPTATSLFAVWKKHDIPSGARLTASANSFGTREMKTRPNLLRASIFEFDGARSEMPYLTETLVELQTNLDDASGERLSAVMESLFKAGALDVWFEPIQMKKCRPAVKLCALLRAENRAKILDVFFRHSGAFGVRETVKTRYSLERTWHEVETEYGSARVKSGMNTSGEELVAAPEFDDCMKLARETGASFERVYRETIRRYGN